METGDPRLPSGSDFPRKRAHTDVRSSRELVGYVIRITVFCVACAVTGDVVNHFVFFDGWHESFRSWAVTAVLTTMIAAPISRIVGKAHLDLFRAQQEAERLSRTDPLTSLANRRALIEAAEAPPPAALVLVIFDIDRFKRINDTLGHIAGDRVIQAVSDTMVTHLHSLGLLCRLGGEEFALLASGDRLEDVLDGVWAFADLLAAHPIKVGDSAVTVTMSAGIAVRPPGGSFNQLYADADEALYTAKAAGRNRVSYSVSVEPHAVERRRWRSAAEDTGSGEIRDRGGRSVA